MEKPADALHPIHDLIRRRWSPRSFAEKPVDPATLRSLLEAARWAPSSNNEQPWSYIVATKEDSGEFERMVNCLNPGNQGWAKNAPVLMISVAHLNFQRNNEPNRVALYDLGEAAAYLTIEALSRGLYVHQMAGIQRDKARETYVIPEGYSAETAIAIGYAGDPSQLPEDLQKKEAAARTRKPLENFVFSGRFGEPSPIVKP